MAAQVYELIDKGTFLGQLSLIRWHLVDPGGTADPAVMASDYIAHVLPVLVVHETLDYFHTSVIYKQVYPVQGLQVEVPITSGGQGTDTHKSLPGTVTWSIKWTIGATVHLGGDTGPHIKRGGKHLSGLDENDVTGNSLVDPVGMQTAAANLFAAFTALSSDSWELCVAHQPLPVGHVSPPVSRYALVTGAISQGVGTQVSRKPRHGI